MRIAVAVVVGLVLSVSSHGVHAEEARRERSERCLEICNFDFEKCSKAEGPKGPGRCNIDVVRCKNACPFVTVEEPVVPTAVSHQRCVDRCRKTYETCLRQAENKTTGGKCAADDMRCEQACPKPPEVVAVPSPPAPAAAVPAATKPLAARVEGAAAPAPAAATSMPAVPAVGADVPPPTGVRSEAVAAPATAPAGASATAARPAQAERGFFATLGCFFVACEPAGSTPCLQQCGKSYDECLPRESGKRGGECNTRLMNCRQACSRGEAPTP